MGRRLELPSGDAVEPGDVLLHDGYPYRYVPSEDDEDAFVLSPLYWGDSGMDIPFRDPDALAAQWSDDSRGTLSPGEWEAWLDGVRDEDWVDAEEVATFARELPVDASVADESADDADADDGSDAGDGDEPGDDAGFLARLRGLVGR